MRGPHLRLCGVGLALALGYLVLTGGSAGGVGILVAALVCPLAMVVAMTVLMGRTATTPAPAAPGDVVQTPVSTEQTDPDARSSRP